MRDSQRSGRTRIALSQTPSEEGECQDRVFDRSEVIYGYLSCFSMNAFS